MGLLLFDMPVLWFAMLAVPCQVPLSCSADDLEAAVGALPRLLLDFYRFCAACCLIGVLGISEPAGIVSLLPWPRPHPTPSLCGQAS